MRYEGRELNEDRDNRITADTCNCSYYIWTITDSKADSDV